MSHITIEHSSHEERRAILEANACIDLAEVLLCNLLALRHTKKVGLSFLMMTSLLL